MKTSVMFVIAGLVLLSVVCYASELKEKSSTSEVLSTIFHFEQPEERGCQGLGKKCNDSSTCCEGMMCSFYSKWCIPEGPWSKFRNSGS
uniref:GTx1-14 n=1 Tax=Grammostola rosea TaxID=432528 RepID=M5B4R2_GRARO|nr:GTx1-14 [Grammostola rosea]